MHISSDWPVINKRDGNLSSTEADRFTFLPRWRYPHSKHFFIVTFLTDKPSHEVLPLEIIPMALSESKHIRQIKTEDLLEETIDDYFVPCTWVDCLAKDLLKALKETVSISQRGFKAISLDLVCRTDDGHPLMRTHYYPVSMEVS